MLNYVEDAYGREKIATDITSEVAVVCNQIAKEIFQKNKVPGDVAYAACVMLVEMIGEHIGMSGTPYRTDTTGREL